MCMTVEVIAQTELTSPGNLPTKSLETENIKETKIAACTTYFRFFTGFSE